MRKLCCLVVLALTLAACGSDESTTGNGSVTEPGASDPGPVGTTGPVDTTGPASEPCEPPTSTDSVSVDVPLAMSSLVGRELRTEVRPCSAHVVLELQGDGEMPGYRVEYVDDPVRLSPSDLEVDIAGAATLVLSVAVWMMAMDGESYEGTEDTLPTNVEVIQELRLIENFEGMHQWAIGLDRERPFSVTTLSDPPRIVIDIAP